MDTKIPDHWKDLKLELEPETYKTYKALINDYDEHYNKSKKKIHLKFIKQIKLHINNLEMQLMLM